MKHISNIFQTIKKEHIQLALLLIRNKIFQLFLNFGVIL